MLFIVFLIGFIMTLVSHDAFKLLKDGGSRFANDNQPRRYQYTEDDNNEGPAEYYFKGKGEMLSNFYEFKLKLFDRTFGSSESAYQYCKAVFHKYYEVAEDLVYARSGLAAKAISHKVPTDPEWHEIKADVMRVIIDAKMEQCHHFRKFMLARPETVFIENTDNEYWARGNYY